MARVFREYLQAVRSFRPDAKRYLIYTALGAVSWSAFNLTFNLYVHSLGYLQDFIGLLNGLPSVVILVVGLPIGMLADRKGYLPFLIGGSLLSAATSLGLGLATSRGALLAFALLGGLGASCTWVIGAPMLMSISSREERVVLFSVQQALMMGAGLVGSLMAGSLPELVARLWGVSPTETLPLRLTYLVGAGFNLLALWPVLAMARSARRAAAQASDGVAAGPASAAPGRGGWASPLPRSLSELGLFLKLLGPSALISIGAGAMVVFFQLFFNLRFGLNPGAIGVLFAFSSVITAVATLVSPVAARRLGRVRTIVLTQLASIPFLLALAWSYNLQVVVAAYYLRSALMNMSGPLQTTFALEQVREEQRATLTSLQAMLGSLGRGGLGPIVSGYIQVRWGFSAAFTLTTVLYVIGTSLFWAFFRKAERASAEPAATTVAPAEG
ncbi:MAG: MFS transporter [Firmicutes bacterium]|nr:MFS transporter [Bacillota bacterium]